MRKKLLTLLLSAAAMVVGCKSTKTTDHTAAAIPANSFRMQWTRDLGLKNDPPREMYVRGNSLYMYTSQNVLYNLNRGSGDLVFICTTAQPGAMVRPPLLALGSTVVPTDTRLDLVDGRGFRTGSIDVHNPLRSGVVADDMSLYVGVDADDGSGRLVAVDPTKKYSTARWQLRTGGAVTSTPAVYQKVIYAASTDGGVYAVAQDRTAVWPIPNGVFHTGGQVMGNLYADKSGVYVSSTDSKLYVLDPKSGRIRWQYFAGLPLFEGPVVTANHVYQQVPGVGLVSIAKNEGGITREASWKYADAKVFLAESDKLVFVSDNENAIVALDINTGEYRFKSARRDLKTFAMNPLDGTIYAATADGKVVSAVAVTKFGQVGELVWSEPKDVSILASAQ